MNPSIADWVESDDTVNDFIRYAENHEDKFRYLKVVNLYPVMETDPDKLPGKIKYIIERHGEAFLYKLLNENLEYIYDEITKADKIILGWGNYKLDHLMPLTHRYITSKICEEILNINKKVFSFTFKSAENITKYGQPSHPKNRNKITGSTILEIAPFYGIKTNIDKEMDKEYLN